MTWALIMIFWIDGYKGDSMASVMVPGYKSQAACVEQVTWVRKSQQNLLTSYCVRVK